MARRRMFSNEIIGSARFLKMPATSRLLYYDLGMDADDDGCVEAFGTMRRTGATEDDLRVLASKGFVRILNEDLVSYILDWNTNNQIRKDRYHESIYKNIIDTTCNVVIEDGNQMATSCQPNSNQMATKVRLGKYSSDKSSGDKAKKKKTGDVFSEFASGDDDLLKALRDFEKMRKEIEKPMSDRAKSMLLTKLQSFPRAEWIPILEQSIFHDWQGIFPLQDSSPRPARGQPQASKGGSAMDALRSLHAQYEDEE